MRRSRRPVKRKVASDEASGVTLTPPVSRVTKGRKSGKGAKRVRQSARPTAPVLSLDDDVTTMSLSASGPLESVPPPPPPPHPTATTQAASASAAATATPSLSVMGNVTYPFTFAHQNDPKSLKVCVGFEFYPFHKGSRYLCYNGTFHGTGHYRWPHGEHCVVKARKTAQCSVEEDWKLSLKAEEIVGRSKTPFPIEFLKHTLVRCDEVSQLGSYVFGRGSRPIQEGELLLVATLLEKVQGFGPEYQHPWLEALSHYSWHTTGGELVLCEFQGRKTDGAYTLLPPRIHSKDLQYGSQDRGLGGIQSFFKRHLCSPLCQDYDHPFLTEFHRI